MTNPLRFFLITATLILLANFVFPACIFASERMEKIQDFLNRGDHETAVPMLEDYFNELANEKKPIQDKIQGAELFIAGRMLADLYAWKLHKPDRALEIYLILEKQVPEPPEAPYALPLKLFIAEIYERQNALPKATATNPEKAIAPLVDVIKGQGSLKPLQSDYLRYGAIKALGKTGSTSVLGTLITTISAIDPDSKTTLTSVMIDALADNPREIVLPALQQTLGHDEQKLAKTLSIYELRREVHLKNLDNNGKTSGRSVRMGRASISDRSLTAGPIFVRKLS